VRSLALSSLEEKNEKFKNVEHYKVL